MRQPPARKKTNRKRTTIEKQYSKLKLTIRHCHSTSYDETTENQIKQMYQNCTPSEGYPLFEPALNFGGETPTPGKRVLLPARFEQKVVAELLLHQSRLRGQQ